MRLAVAGRRSQRTTIYWPVFSGAAAVSPLRELVANAVFNKGVALGALGRSEEAIAAYDDLLVRINGATELSNLR